MMQKAPSISAPVFAAHRGPSGGGICAYVGCVGGEVWEERRVCET